MRTKRECKAKGCDNKFLPWRSTQVACSPKCAQEIYRQKAAAKAEKAQRRKDRAWLKANKPIRKLVAETQQAFNAYIRVRDAMRGLPCISCGRSPREAESAYTGVGGAWDAGHFLSRGAYPELRFNEFNCHRQCKVCNGGAGQYAGKDRTVSQAYEENLRERIGDPLVDWLQGPHEVPKLSRDDLEALKAYYRKAKRDIEALDAS